MADPVVGQSAIAQGGDSAPSGTADATPNAGDAGSWFDSLPDGIKAEKSLEAFKGKPISAVVESYVNAQKLVGGSLRVPGKDAKPEDIEKFHNEAYDKLGRPASPDKYTFQKPNVDGVTVDDKAVQSFLPVAHKLGLNSKQVEGLLQFQADLTAASAPNHAENFAQTMKDLTDGDEQTPGWGSTAPRYIAVAKRALETMFHPDAQKAIIDSGLGNNAHFIRAMFQVGKMGMEDGLVIGEGEALKDGRTGALSELEKIMADPKHAYFDRSHQDHDAAVSKVLDLRRYAMA